MKFIDINKRFTEIVSKYLANGYQFNTATMGGSQGEVAKVDLTNGTEIIRISLDTFHTYDDMCLEGYRIEIGLSTDNLVPNSSSDKTLWSSHMNVIEIEEFYKLYAISYDDVVFGTREEAAMISTKKSDRWSRKQVRKEEYTPSDDAIAIAKRIIRKQFGCRRVTESDIKLVKSNGKYTVRYRSHSYALH